MGYSHLLQLVLSFSEMGLIVVVIFGRMQINGDIFLHLRQQLAQPISTPSSNMKSKVKRATFSLSTEVLSSHIPSDIRPLHVPSNQSQSHRCLLHHNRRRCQKTLPPTNVGRNHRKPIRRINEMAPRLGKARRSLHHLHSTHDTRQLCPQSRAHLHCCSRRYKDHRIHRELYE